MSAGRPWAPVLEGEVAERALAIVQRLATELAAGGRSSDESLYSGRAGIGLLFAYLDRAFPGRGYGARACELVGEAMELVGDEPAPCLAWGVAGLAWAADHLHDLGLAIESDDSIDEFILQVLDIRPWPYPYDLMDGLAGLALSALPRRERPLARQVLEAVLEHLEALVEQQPAGLVFGFTPDPAKEPRDHLLGVAHGLGGVVGVMARYVAADVQRPRARRLLDGSIATLLAHRREAPSVRRFPYRAGPVRGPLTGDSAWCNGDVGIAVVLLHASRRANEPAWEAVAVDAAVQLAEDPLARVTCAEPGICHGAAGAAHALDRLHHATGLAPLRAAARQLYVHAMDRYDLGAHDSTVWRAGDGLHEGRTGLALALLAAATAIEPDWDECLLLTT